MTCSLIRKLNSALICEICGNQKNKGLTFTFPDLNEGYGIPAQGRNDSSEKIVTNTFIHLIDL
ncbi:MAG TPA: hypothetical protein DCX89_09375 [Saprospirales bacterium]|nr:hypothetical protein [Saprospirales bacterium]HAY72087.1 hypothetical protein [Saprospirales bacterium]HRQ29973.1 hypothetical protein [Saprospiraceae bacterium]